MKLLPDQSSGRLLPIALLALAIMLVYFLFFHGFVMQHAAYAEDISDKRDRYQRLREVADDREAYAGLLEELRANDQNDAFFRAEQNANAAFASMTNRLKQIISAQADDESSCQVITNQLAASKNKERFKKVTVNIRMRCMLEDFTKVMHALESDVPLVFLDDLTIHMRSVRRARRNNREPQPQELDIRFDMSSYLNQTES